MNWFYLIEFTYANHRYLMLTNEGYQGWIELEEIPYKYVERMEYKGPTEWIVYLQNILENELDDYAVLDYDSPCYYEEDFKVVRKKFIKLMNEYNDDCIQL